MTSIYNRTKHSNNRTQRNNPVAFVLEASNLPLASQCATLAAVSASKNACNRTQRLVLQEHHFKTRPKIPHFLKERLSSLCFPACFLSWRLEERAARWSVSVYAAELSPFTPFVVVLEREAVLNPSRSTSSKRFPSVSTWTPRPVKVKLYERDKGASRSSGSPHTLRRRYTASWWVSLSDEADRSSQKQDKHMSSAPHSLSCTEQGRTPEHHDNQTEWSIFIL